MFGFPRAISKETWNGQGDLFGGLLPYYGGGSLGLCFGASVMWVINGAPAAAQAFCRQKVEDIKRCQQQMHLNGQTFSSSPRKQLIEFSADDISNNTTYALTTYDPASHVVLDIVDKPVLSDCVLCFYYVSSPSEGEGGHAIAISFAAPNQGRLFDPNWGCAGYNARAALCNDLHGLLATYVVGGRLTETYLLSYEVFGAFQGAT